MRAGGARTYELEWGAGVSPACGDGGRKPSLSAWKPQRGQGVESWARGRLARLRAGGARTHLNLNRAWASRPHTLRLGAQASPPASD